MANNVWQSAGDASWSNNANWSEGVPPGPGDIAIFDGAVSTFSCMVDAAVNCDGIVFQNAYTGTFDCNGFAITTGASGINMSTNGTNGVWRCRTSTISIGGTLDTLQLTSWFRDSSTLRFTGTGDWRMRSGQTVHRCEIAPTGNVTMLVNSMHVQDDLTIEAGGVLGARTFNINGSLFTLEGTLTLVAGTTTSAYCDITVGAAGRVDGTGTLRLYSPNSIDNTAGGSFADSTEFRAYSGTTVSGGTYGNVYLYSFGSGTTTIGSAAGQTINCNNLTFESFGSDSYVIDAATHNPNWEVRGSITTSVGTGSLTYNRGTGTISLTGTGNQSVAPLGPTEWFIINKLSGRVTCTGSWICRLLTCTSGDLDLNGQYIASEEGIGIDSSSGFRFHNGTDADQGGGRLECTNGSVALDGTAGNKLEIDNLDFLLFSGVSGVATHCNVQDSQTTGAGAPMDATSATNTDLGGNTGWDFGEVAATENAAFVACNF